MIRVRSAVVDGECKRLKDETMSGGRNLAAEGFDALYSSLDSPLMQQLRLEAWVRISASTRG